MEPVDDLPRIGHVFGCTPRFRIGHVRVLARANALQTRALAGNNERADMSHEVLQHYGEEVDMLSNAVAVPLAEQVLPAEVGRRDDAAGAAGAISFQPLAIADGPLGTSRPCLVLQHAIFIEQTYVPEKR